MGQHGKGRLEDGFSIEYPGVNRKRNWLNAGWFHLSWYRRCDGRERVLFGIEPVAIKVRVRQVQLTHRVVILALQHDERSLQHDERSLVSPHVAAKEDRVGCCVLLRPND